MHLLVVYSLLIEGSGQLLEVTRDVLGVVVSRIVVLNTVVGAHASLTALET